MNKNPSRIAAVAAALLLSLALQGCGSFGILQVASKAGPPASVGNPVACNSGGVCEVRVIVDTHCRLRVDKVYVEVDRSTELRLVLDGPADFVFGLTLHDGTGAPLNIRGVDVINGRGKYRGNSAAALAMPRVSVFKNVDTDTSSNRQTEFQYAVFVRRAPSDNRPCDVLDPWIRNP